MGKKMNTLTQEQAQRIWNTRPKLPEKKIQKFAHEEVFGKEQCFFKYREAGHRYGHCTACGKDVQIDIENMRLYTQEHLICRHARHNDKVYCPACGHAVTVKDAGRGRSGLYNTAIIAVAQRTRDDGVLLTFVRVVEDMRTGRCVETEVRKPVYAAYFNLNKHFVAEQAYGGGLYISVKQKPTRQLPCTVEPETLSNRWDCSGGEGAKLLGFEDVLEKSNLRYLPWEQYHEAAQQLYSSAIDNYPVNLLGLLYQYSRHPVLTERLIKEGHADIVAEQVEWDHKPGLNYRQVVPYKAMRLTKQEYAWLKDSGWAISCALIKAVQMAKKHGFQLTDETIRLFYSIEQSYNNTTACEKSIALLRQHLSPHKTVGWIDRQATKLYGSAVNVLNDYWDYIAQCRTLRLDTTDKSVAVPQDLRALHEQYSAEIQMRQNELKVKEQAQREQQLKAELPKLKKRYSYAHAGLFIRPAEGAKDLLKEGSAQHNCVYSCYTEKYLSRKTDILFVRKEDEPEKSYVTVEFKDGAIIQCRAGHNRPAPPDVQEFMQAWLAYMKANKKKNAVR